ncbi:hypothetical protein VWM66_10810, partial [Campylobacter jejuni]
FLPSVFAFIPIGLVAMGSSVLIRYYNIGAPGYFFFVFSCVLGREKENVIHSKLDIMLARFDEKSDDEKLDFYSKAKTYLKE